MNVVTIPIIDKKVFLFILGKDEDISMISNYIQTQMINLGIVDLNELLLRIVNYTTLYARFINQDYKAMIKTFLLNKKLKKLGILTKLEFVHGFAYAIGATDI